MMTNIIVRHKFESHKIMPDTRILIIGTFNPAVLGNEAEFFYGRKRNNLWKLLPESFGEDSLKKKETTITEALVKPFMKRHKIDFMDLISEIMIEKEHANNYSDDYIDGKVTNWNDDKIISLMKKGSIRKVLFTRKTFTNKTKNIKRRIKRIEECCMGSGIKFEYILTPARGISEKKRKQWKKAFAT